jgi:hypothetical protein
MQQLTNWQQEKAKCIIDGSVELLFSARWKLLDKNAGVQRDST